MRKIKIEDFHVGFEYEQLVPNPERYLAHPEMIWLKKKYTLESTRLRKIKQLIDSGSIRIVKGCPTKESIIAEARRSRKIKIARNWTITCIFVSIVIITFILITT